MSYNSLNTEEAESKLIQSFANLIWIIPILVIGEILIFYNSGERMGITGPLVNVFTTLIWFILLLRIIKVIDSQMDKKRVHDLKLLEKKANLNKS